MNNDETRELDAVHWFDPLVSLKQPEELID